MSHSLTTKDDRVSFTFNVLTCKLNPNQNKLTFAKPNEFSFLRALILPTTRNQNKYSPDSSPLFAFDKERLHNARPNPSIRKPIHPPHLISKTMKGFIY